MEKRRTLDVTHKVLVVSDLQVPYVDWPVWYSVLRFARELKPDMVILNGDIHDFYVLSKYSQDPARTDSLQEDIDKLQREVLAPLAELKVPLIYTKGNHEERLQRYLWTNASKLSCLRSLKISSLFELAKYGCRFEEKGVKLGKHLFVTHGHLHSVHSAYTAKRHWERYGSSMVIGHSHRIGQFCVRDMRGVHEVVEAGCLCSLDPEWTTFPNWQQGFAVVTTMSDGTFNTTVVKIINREFFMYGDKVYRV